MTALEGLKAARAKVAHGWCQDVHARDENGIKVPPSSDLAVRWCVDGAFLSAAKGNANAVLAFLRAVGDSSIDSIVQWNDVVGRTQAEVLAVFDRAIANLS